MMIRRLGAAMAAIVLTLSACDSAASPPPATPAPTQAPGATAAPQTQAPSNEIDIVRVALNGAVLNFDPLKAMSAADTQVVDLVSGKLMRLDRDGRPQLDLLESMDVSQDGLTYTMRLLPGLKYSDGTDLVAADVVYAFDLVKDAPLTFKALTSPVASVAAPDDRTLIWRLSRAFPDWILHLTNHFGVIHPRQRLEANRDGYFQRPVSAGPYLIAEGGPGEPRIVLERNPNYAQGPRAIRRLEFIGVPDLTSRTLQLGQGDIQFVHQLSPSVRGVIAPEVETFNHGEGATLKLTFNGCLPADHPLRNRDVREAISLAIDRQKIAERAFFGVAQPALGMAPKGLRGWEPVLPGNGARDLAAAQVKLQGTPFASGFSFTLLTWPERPGYQEAALLIKQDLAELGIEVSVEGVQISVALTRMDAHDFEANFGRAGGGEPMVSWMSNLYTPNTFWGSKACYENATMTDLLLRVGSEVDDTRRAALWKEINALAYADIPFIHVVEAQILSGTRLPREIIDLVEGRDVFVVGPVQ